MYEKDGPTAMISNSSAFLALGAKKILTTPIPLRYTTVVRITSMSLRWGGGEEERNRVCM